MEMGIEEDEMICYRDMTFCSAECKTRKCERNWKLMDKTSYVEWSKAFSGSGPVAFADFSENCEKYKTAT